MARAGNVSDPNFGMKYEHGVDATPRLGDDESRSPGGDISDRRGKTMDDDYVGATPKHGIEDGGAKCGESEGGGKSIGAESAPRLTGGDTTPQRRVTTPITDRATNRRIDEGDCGMTRGGNEG